LEDNIFVYFIRQFVVTAYSNHIYSIILLLDLSKYFNYNIK